MSWKSFSSSADDKTKEKKEKEKQEEPLPFLTQHKTQLTQAAIVGLLSPLVPLAHPLSLSLA
jgi:hypothetical protein